MLNKAEIIGRLGNDPESTTTNSGKVVTRFNVATTEAWTDRDGQKQERTEWHRVVMWNELAVHCDRFLNKGRQVYVEGKIQTRSWENNQGLKQYTTEIVANKVIFLGEKTQAQSTEPSFDSTSEIPF